MHFMYYIFLQRHRTKSTILFFFFSFLILCSVSLENPDRDTLTLRKKIKGLPQNYSKHLDYFLKEKILI